MSTTDTRAAFEAWMREEYGADDDMLKRPYEDRYFWPRAADAWAAWQAATEAAKATGTAGGQWKPKALQGPRKSIFYGGNTNEHLNPLVVLISAEDYEKCCSLYEAPIVPHEMAYTVGGVADVSYVNGWNDCRDTVLGKIDDDPTNAPAEAARQPAPVVAVPDELRSIGELLRTQDNRITDQPIFIVQQRRRITGIDTEFCENIVWLHSESEYNEADQSEHEELEAEYQNTGRQREGWLRTGYQDEWEFVTACFTEQGCKDYLAKDGHNLKEPRIYAEGSYRNEEFRAVRNWLMSLEAATNRSQPAPVVVKPWETRMQEYFAQGSVKMRTPASFMADEIIDSRAALAATAAPVVDIEQLIGIIRSFGYTTYSQSREIAEALAARSQP